MRITARRLMWTLAIAASAVSGGLYGTTDVAYATHVDAGHALFHCHRAAVHTSRTHTRRQCAAHPRCGPCARRHPEVSVAARPGRYRGLDTCLTCAPAAQAASSRRRPPSPAPVCCPALRIAAQEVAR